MYQTYFNDNSYSVLEQDYFAENPPEPPAEQQMRDYFWGDLQVDLLNELTHRGIHPREAELHTADILNTWAVYNGMDAVEAVDLFMDLQSV